MADAADVLRGITRRPGTRYTALVPNEKGLARAIEAGLSEVAIFAAASETFSRRNINAGIDEAMRDYAVCWAGGAARPASGCAGTCPPASAARSRARCRPSAWPTLAARLLDECGVFEVAVSDTIGVAHPGSVRRVLDAVLARVPVERVALHFHDTRGTALANVLAALPYGVTTFDASAGGLGGCPFAPGARGNLATEDLLYMLDGLGIATGVSIEAVTAASIALEPAVGHAVPSRYVQAVRIAQCRNPRCGGMPAWREPWGGRGVAVGEAAPRETPPLMTPHSASSTPTRKAQRAGPRLRARPWHRSVALRVRGRASSGSSSVSANAW